MPFAYIYLRVLKLQEIMKVKGFQGTYLVSTCSDSDSHCVVAPAELEGHLLDHPDVADCCVVGILDDYSGEVPLAFVALSHDALERVKKDPSEAQKIKAALIKVRRLASGPFPPTLTPIFVGSALGV